VYCALLALLGQSVAQQTEAVCMPSFSWMFNSLVQSPCVVASYLEGACASTVYDISALEPDSHYVGPDQGEGNACSCSSVVYALASACGDCQGGNVTEKWSFWIANCTSDQVTQNGYGHAVPPGTAIPAWAYLDVVDEDTFNANEAQTKAGEHGADTFPSTGGNSGSSKSGGSSSANIGAIAGGAVGGVVVIGLIVALIVYLVVRRKRSPAAIYSGDSPTMPMAPALVPPAGASPYMAPSGTGPNSPTTPSEFRYGGQPSYASMPPAQLYNPDHPWTYPAASNAGVPISPGPSVTPYTGSPVSATYTNPNNRFSGMPEI